MTHNQTSNITDEKRLSDFPMHYRLRTLLIVLAVGPPIAALAYQDWGLGLWPIYALVLATIAVAVALALWFLRWARTEYELALKRDMAEPNP